jgi:class 3 adenylate cyclase
MARTYSADEVAAEAELTHDRLARLVATALIEPDPSGGFTFGDVFRAKLFSALIDAGLSETLLARAVTEGSLNLDHVDAYFPLEPGPRSQRTFGDFVASAGPQASVLPAVYEVLGLPRPDPAAPIHVAEEALLERFLEGWRLASDEDVLLRAARLIGEGTRVASLGWVELVVEQMGRPAQERLLSGTIDRFPSEVTNAVAALVRLAPEMFAWLSQHYVEQQFVGTMVDGVERFLAARDLAPMPKERQPPAIVFVDLSGYTKLTEERGDEVAVRTATALQRHAEAVAKRRDGRLVKLLGDGAMLRFADAAQGVEAALDLVETLRTDGSVPAHAGISAGPVVERDLDVFGGTVNLASRIATAAHEGEVLASRTVVEEVEDPTLGFERLGERSLKGIAEPVTLFRVTRTAAVAESPPPSSPPSTGA